MCSCYKFDLLTVKMLPIKNKTSEMYPEVDIL